MTEVHREEDPWEKLVRPPNVGTVAPFANESLFMRAILPFAASVGLFPHLHGSDHPGALLVPLHLHSDALPMLRGAVKRGAKALVFAASGPARKSAQMLLWKRKTWIPAARLGRADPAKTKAKLKHG
jgi:hypothetical protein